ERGAEPSPECTALLLGAGVPERRQHLSDQRVQRSFGPDPGGRGEDPQAGGAVLQSKSQREANQCHRQVHSWSEEGQREGERRVRSLGAKLGASEIRRDVSAATSTYRKGKLFVVEKSSVPAKGHAHHRFVLMSRVVKPLRRG